MPQRMQRWLVVVGVAILTVATPAAADPEADCAQHVATFAQRLPAPGQPDVTSAAAAQIMLDLARPYRATVRECGRRYRKLAGAVEALEARWRAAEAFIRELERAEAHGSVASAERARREQEAARAEAELAAKRRAEAALTRATAASVEKRLGMTDDDALDQAKIREAFQQMPADDFIVVVGAARPAYDPTGAGAVPTDGSDDRIDYHPVDGVMRYEAHHVRRLPDRTAGLIWSVASATALVIVTIDGGRYTAPLAAVAFGVPPRDAAPAALVHDALSPDDIAKLAAAGFVPASYATAIARESRALARCMARRQASACGKHERAAFKAWVGAIVARKKDRKATLAVASARLIALTARAE